jgi:hypothetical protein
MLFRTGDGPVTVGSPAGGALETRLREALATLSPAEVYRRFIAENDALIRQSDLENGREIVTARTLIHSFLVRHWAETQQRRFGYEKPFAVVALGGTGRAEVTPCSDLDFAFLFDDAVDRSNAFLLELQRQMLNTDEFLETYGFRFEPLPFNLDDPPRLAEKQLNSFLDLRSIYDPSGLGPRFRELIRATYDPFEHFLHVRGFWIDRWEKAAGEAERLDRFDIKNDALRLFLAGIWTRAGRDFRHSHEEYARLEDARDLGAYYFLLRIRCFVHSRKKGRRSRAPGGDHPEDLFEFEDFTSFGELLGQEADEVVRFEFANTVRARLLSARRRVARFARFAIAAELTPGRPVGPQSPIACRVAGLAHAPLQGPVTDVARSRAALSLLLASQRYRVPIDPAELQSTFRDPGDWLEPVAELSALFYERRGSLADSLAFLSQFDGALERVFPGQSRFETSIDERVSEERTWMRGALERRKHLRLEEFVREGQEALARAISTERATNLADGVDPRIEAALLGPDQLAAVKLALKTKRLPLTREDTELRNDNRRPIHERFSSGHSDRALEVYYERLRNEAEFSEETVRLARFLVGNRRAFKARAEAGLNDRLQVEEFATQCRDEQWLRALYVFTCADRSEWECREKDPARWFSTDELYTKTMQFFRPGVDPTQHLKSAGFSAEELAILKDFGPDFYGGVYRPHAITFGSHLLRLANGGESAPPKASLVRAGTSRIVGVAARDFRGLAACITGELWHQHGSLLQAHLFSAMNHGLVLDFFHVAQLSDKGSGTDLLRGIERAIRERRHILDSDEVNLPLLEPGRTTLKEWRNGLFLLRHETSRDTAGLVYALAYKVFRHLEGNIFGLQARSTRDGAFVSIYFGLPPRTPIECAQEIVRERFG